MERHHRLGQLARRRGKRKYRLGPRGPCDQNDVQTQAHIGNDAEWAQRARPLVAPPLATPTPKFARLGSRRAPIRPILDFHV